MKKLLLLTSFLFTLTFYAQNNPDFYLAPNGVTCMCPEAEFGDTGTLTINGETKTFTKRTETELRGLKINNIDDPQIALTCTSGIADMNDLFNGFNGNSSSFNQNLEHWDVSQVTDMTNMFIFASTFNQPLNSWDVSKVTSMFQMFGGASAFDQPLNDWNVSQVTNMRSIFNGASLFNQLLGSWDVSQVTTMTFMFNDASSFNQPLDNWDVSKVTDMQGMFHNATTFDRDLSDWSFNQEVYLDQFLSDSGMSSDNYDTLLQSFDNQNLINLTMGADNIANCDEQTRSNLIDNKGWTIIGDILGQCGDVFNPSTTPFVTTWTVQDDLSIAIYTFNAFNYDFAVDWGDGEIDQNVTADITHNYATPGTYAVSIIGVFPYFKTCENATDSSVCDNAPKLSSIESWGDQEWRTMNGSFRSANFNINTAQTPDLSNVTSMYRTFLEAAGFYQNINNWDVSQITDMTETFRDASNFNQPLNNWDVSNVTNMDQMFFRATSFNQPLNNWDVKQVTDMYTMFYGASSFNQPLDNWDVSQVTNMRFMFSGAESFNQPLNNWDVSLVTVMEYMFYGAESFNQPLDNWDVSQVTDMRFMFYEATIFNQDLSGWCVEQILNEPSEFAFNSALQDDFFPNWGAECAVNNPEFYLASNGVTCLCPEAEFGDSGTLTINGETKTFIKRSREQLDELIFNDDQDPQIALTCTSGITDMQEMFFAASSFNQDLNNWDVSQVTNMGLMFSGAESFDQPLNNWDVSQVTGMNFMFGFATSFNQPLDNWDVSQVTDMYAMFGNATSFNQPLDNWDVSQVTGMKFMFEGAKTFNQPLDDWDVSQVTDMGYMFYGAESFDQPLNNWDVSQVTFMDVMFYGAESFNQPLDNWDVSQVTDMYAMFGNATSFNQPLNNWDVSNVADMTAMFYDATIFNQDLSGWCVNQIPDEPENFADNSALQNDFFPNWGAECNLSTTNPEAIGFNILIYPNPSNSKVFIENDGQIILSKIKLIDMLGREIKIFSASQITNGLDVSGVDAGNYFVQFTTVDNQQFVKRLIVN
jgi:surface protein